MFFYMYVDVFFADFFIQHKLDKSVFINVTNILSDTIYST